jgi:hypothetical protein
MSLKCLYQTRRVSGNVDITDVFVPKQESEWQCRCHWSVSVATNSSGLVQTPQWYLHCYSLSWFCKNTSVTSKLPLTLLVWNKHFSDIYIATHSPGLVRTLQWQLHCHSLSCVGTNTSVTFTLPLPLMVWYKHFSDIYIAIHSPGLVQTL